MILAVPIETKSMNTQLSRTFGRTKYFALIHKKDNTIEYIDNKYYRDNDKVGHNVVALLKQNGTTAFLAYEYGLNIQKIADKNKIQLVLIADNMHKLNDIFIYTKNNK